MKDQYVLIDNWGKDHWSTLAYLETRVVDYKGQIDHRHMRCHPRLHRELATIQPVTGELQDSSAFPTRLRDGSVIDRHDDWSCVEDMKEAGLLTWTQRRVNGKMFDCVRISVRLTKRGYEVAAALRLHKASGKNFITFNPNGISTK